MELDMDHQRKLDTIIEYNSKGDAILKKALPLIYIHDFMNKKTRNEVIDDDNSLSKESVQADLRQLMEAIDRLHELCELSAYPAKICGKRSNCCHRKMISIFHEQKQMGIMLRKSFKGTHIWIPPIRRQIEDALKLGMTNEKID